MLDDFNMQEDSVQSAGKRPTLMQTLNWQLVDATDLKSSSESLRAEESELRQDLRKSRTRLEATIDTMEFDCESALEALTTAFRKEQREEEAQRWAQEKAIKDAADAPGVQEALSWTESFVSRTERYLFGEESETIDPSVPLATGLQSEAS